MTLKSLMKGTIDGIGEYFLGTQTAKYCEQQKAVVREFEPYEISKRGTINAIESEKQRFLNIRHYLTLADAVTALGAGTYALLGTDNPSSRMYAGLTAGAVLLLSSLARKSGIRKKVDDCVIESRRNMFENEMSNAAKERLKKAEEQRRNEDYADHDSGYDGWLRPGER